LFYNLTRFSFKSYFCSHFKLGC